MVIAQDDQQVDLPGELDLTGGDELEARVAPRLTRGARVTIGLEGVTFADSSGLGALLALQETARENGAELILRGPSQSVLRVMEITAITDQFTIV